MSAHRPRAVLFDAYGTLFDVHSVTAAAEELFPGSGPSLSQTWRETQMTYSRLLTLAGRYEPFWDLTRSALRFAARSLASALEANAEARLMDEYLHLTPFGENHGVLTTLHARGVRTGVLSNGDPEMLAAATESAGFADLLDPILSVQPVKRYKPDPATYALGPAALDLPAADILFVSSNGWDAIGATWFGYTTLWVNRGGAPADELGTHPTHTADSLVAVLDILTG